MKGPFTNCYICDSVAFHGTLSIIVFAVGTIINWRLGLVLSLAGPITGLINYTIDRNFR